MLKKIAFSAVVLVLGLSVSNVHAAQHLGDIQPWKVGGQVYTNGNLFGADLGDLYGGLYRTTNPGFDADTDKGAFGASNWLQLQGLGSLKFWNGSAWSNSVPNGEHVEIEDALGSIMTFSAGGVTNPFGVIDELDASGDLHSHLKMSIKNASNALAGTVGAYWIELKIFETLAEGSAAVSTASAPFSLIFNRGLGATAYDSAVNAVAAVPVPGAVWLFGSALAGLIASVRKRSIGVSS
ncbi:MAG: hypothetical protein QX196_14175 [Methylococcaceae bacterium]